MGGGASPDGHNFYTIAGELMSITPFRFDHVENFFAIREWSGLVELIIAEDTEATIQILLKGRSTKMQHVHRTHRVNLDWLYEVFTSSNTRCRLRYVSTKHQIADMHMKAITNADVWLHLSKLAQLVNTPCTRLAPAGSHLR